jgi:hypothetical protein
LSPQPHRPDAHAPRFEKGKFRFVGQQAVDFAVDAPVAHVEFAFFGDQLPAQHGGFFDGIGVGDRFQRLNSLNGS